MPCKKFLCRIKNAVCQNIFNVYSGFTTHYCGKLIKYIKQFWMVGLSHPVETKHSNDCFSFPFKNLQ